MKSDIILLEPFTKEDQGVLKTTEAKSLLLLEYGRQVYSLARSAIISDEYPFPKVEQEVISQAIQRSFLDRNTHPIAFLLSSRYGGLEELVEKIKKEKTKGYTSELMWDGGTPINTDNEFYRKMSLVNYVLLPLKRYKEAEEQLVVAGRYKEALEVATQIGLSEIVELCEKVQDLFDEGLNKIKGQNATLEDRLKKSHVASFVNGTNRQTKDRIYRWNKALEKAQEYDFSDEMIEGIKRKALYSMIDKLDRSLESGKPFSHNIGDVINWAKIYTQKLIFDDERRKYSFRLLNLLSEREAHETAMRVAVEFGDYRTAFSEAKIVLNHLKEETEEKEETEIEEFVENCVVGELNDIECVKEYIRRFKLENAQSSTNLAKRFKLEKWLVEEYESKASYFEAGYVAESSCNPRAKELYKMAKDYGRAFEFTQDKNEQIELSLKEAEEQLRNFAKNRYVRRDSVMSSIDWLRTSIEIAKQDSDLKKVFGTAVSAVDVLINQGFYKEAVLFGLEIGMDKIGKRLPKDAVVPYEKSFDFSSCALISEAQGNERDAEVYKRLATYFEK